MALNNYAVLLNNLKYLLYKTLTGIKSLFKLIRFIKQNPNIDIRHWAATGCIITNGFFRNKIIMRCLDPPW